MTPQEWDTLLRSLLGQRTTHRWQDFLPITLAAWQDEGAWMTAFGRLALDDQYGLLARLRQDDAGPMAAVLIAVLGRNAARLHDEQIRLELTALAGMRAGETADTLDRMRHELEVAREHVEVLRGRAATGLDLAAEFARLEQTAAQLRANEIGAPGFDRIHALEREIAELELRRRIAANYDAVGRTAHREELATQARQLTDAKSRLEREIAAAIAERDASAKHLAVAERELTLVRTEANRLTSQLDQAKREADSLRLQASRAEQGLPAAQAEMRAAEAELKRREGELELVRARTVGHRQRLRALQGAANAAGLAELERKIADVYNSLPPDRADPAFQAASRSS